MHWVIVSWIGNSRTWKCYLNGSLRGQRNGGHDLKIYPTKYKTINWTLGEDHGQSCQLWEWYSPNVPEIVLLAIMLSLSWSESPGFWNTYHPVNISEASYHFCTPRMLSLLLLLLLPAPIFVSNLLYFRPSPISWIATQNRRPSLHDQEMRVI